MRVGEHSCIESLVPGKAVLHLHFWWLFKHTLLDSTQTRGFVTSRTSSGVMGLGEQRMVPGDQKGCS